MKLRKIRALVLIAFGICLYCIALSNAEENPHKTLFRVSSGKNSVYLMGSIHLLKNDTAFLTDSVIRAFDDSKALVLEVDLNRMADPGVQQMMLKKGMLAEGDSLDKQINKKTYALAKNKAAELGLDIEKFRHCKPWFFIMMLAETKLQQLGFNAQKGIDKYFFAKAVQCGKQVVGLETLEQQMDMLDTMSRLNQDDFVRYGIKDLDVMEQELDSIIRAWSTGDMKALDQTILKSFKGFPEVYKTLIIMRNKHWITKIESFLNQKDNFMIVVGAAHLAGRNGLVELLKKKGYIVEQL